MYGGPEVRSSTRSPLGCRSESSLTPARHASRIREMTVAAELGSDLPQSPVTSKGALRSVTDEGSGRARDCGHGVRSRQFQACDARFAGLQQGQPIIDPGAACGFRAASDPAAAPASNRNARRLFGSEPAISSGCARRTDRSGGTRSSRRKVNLAALPAPSPFDEHSMHWPSLPRSSTSSSIVTHAPRGVAR